MRVVFGVGDLRLVQHVVQVLVVAEFFAQFLDFTRGIFHWPLNYNLTRKRENTPITAYKNTVLIYNPRAGRFERKGGAPIERAAAILSGQGHHITVAPTTGPNTAGAIARGRIQAGADLIVAAGGDGTINEVAEGMIGSTVPLAILPGGTANVLAMEMKLGKDLNRAAERLSGMQPRRISVGHVTCDGGQVKRHFLLMAGIGLDAHIVYNVSGALKAGRENSPIGWQAGKCWAANCRRSRWRWTGRKAPAPSLS